MNYDSNYSLLIVTNVFISNLVQANAHFGDKYLIRLFKVHAFFCKQHFYKQRQVEAKFLLFKN